MTDEGLEDSNVSPQTVSETFDLSAVTSRRRQPIGVLLHAARPSPSSSSASSSRRAAPASARLPCTRACGGARQGWRRDADAGWTLPGPRDSVRECPSQFLFFGFLFKAAAVTQIPHEDKRLRRLLRVEPQEPADHTAVPTQRTRSPLPLPREKMPFHHVTAGLLYKGNYLSRSLSDSDSDVLASISVEELDEIREAFKVLDRDGNGFISKQELGMAMRSLGYMPSEVELAIIMQRLDMDGDGQVDFEEFMTILGPKLLSSETREGFLGSTIDTIFWQFDMQRITLEELKHVLFYAFRDHLTMKDIENIIINEEESLKENAGNCQTEFEGVHPSKKNRQTCVRKSLICAFAMAFIISVMLIAANQMLRNGME